MSSLVEHVPWVLAAVAALLAVMGAAFVVRGLALGRRRSRVSLRVLTPKEQAIVSACADALFPPEGPIPVSGTEAGLVTYMDAYLQRAPSESRLLIRLLFQLVEHGPWLWGPRRVRFTRLLPEEQRVALERMAASPIYFRRVAFVSLRLMLTMGYFAHAGVQRAIGIPVLRAAEAA
ncbi:hypothetical protein [Chondromyces apiculatus]|uniref:Uncharacterized protein n=1 Tax=Chondromyces apiculatus DSM 436 TaxID=1192034 RepID=A0A017SVM8_9BACT|nr:hypothetical protein [Chondromyces apiculatus]EYF00827.1 Hypothetical protein CAP_8988 [Chondromyces apiculatus DSM 436]